MKLAHMFPKWICYLNSRDRNLRVTKNPKWQGMIHSEKVRQHPLWESQKIYKMIRSKHLGSQSRKLSCSGMPPKIKHHLRGHFTHYVKNWSIPWSIQSNPGLAKFTASLQLPPIINSIHKCQSQSLLSIWPQISNLSRSCPCKNHLLFLMALLCCILAAWISLMRLLKQTCLH